MSIEVMIVSELTRALRAKPTEKVEMHGIKRVMEIGTGRDEEREQGGKTP